LKILLDECRPAGCGHHLQNHACHTAEWAGLKGYKNGELLRLAELAGYQVLLTVDDGTLHQQNLAKRSIAIVAIRAESNQIEDLSPLCKRSKLPCERKPGQLQTIA
jgi:hypothetical protein